jgi:hypothetical protein
MGLKIGIKSSDWLQSPTQGLKDFIFNQKIDGDDPVIIDAG